MPTVSRRAGDLWQICPLPAALRMPAPAACPAAALGMASRLAATERGRGGAGRGRGRGSRPKGRQGEVGQRLSGHDAGRGRRGPSGPARGMPGRPAPPRCNDAMALSPLRRATGWMRLCLVSGLAPAGPWARSAGCRLSSRVRLVRRLARAARAYHYLHSKPTWQPSLNPRATRGRAATEGESCCACVPFAPAVIALAAWLRADAAQQEQRRVSLDSDWS